MKKSSNEASNLNKLDKENKKKTQEKVKVSKKVEKLTKKPIKKPTQKNNSEVLHNAARLTYYWLGENNRTLRLLASVMAQKGVSESTLKAWSTTENWDEYIRVMPKINTDKFIANPGGKLFLNALKQIYLTDMIVKSSGTDTDTRQSDVINGMKMLQEDEEGESTSAITDLVPLNLNVLLEQLGTGYTIVDIDGKELPQITRERVNLMVSDTPLKEEEESIPIGSFNEEENLENSDYQTTSEEDN